ncbi:MAG: hypothetical protein V4696_03870 [Pseudomonadota bacterium]
MSAPVTVTIRINVNDPAELHRAAVAAYMKSGGGVSLSAALAFLGSADQPNLENCFSEVVCDNVANYSLGFQFI